MRIDRVGCGMPCWMERRQRRRPDGGEEEIWNLSWRMLMREPGEK
jgi:hypothetical protein